MALTRPSRSTGWFEIAQPASRQRCRSDAIACAVKPIIGMLCRFRGGLETPRRLPAVHVRQTHVHQDQIGRIGFGHFDACSPVSAVTTSKPLRIKRRDSISRFKASSSTSRRRAIQGDPPAGTIASPTCPATESHSGLVPSAGSLTRKVLPRPRSGRITGRRAARKSPWSR